MRCAEFLAPTASSRFACVGTRSAFATRTVASVPPFDAGSAGRQVATVSPCSLNLIKPGWGRPVGGQLGPSRPTAEFARLSAG
jgi:hypothetical protein